MLAARSAGPDDRPRSKFPAWFGYAVAATAAALTLLPSLFHVAKFPLPYVLLVMVIAYYYAEGPAMTSFVLGLAGIATYVVGGVAGGLATLVLRRSKERASRLARELSEAKNLAEIRHGQIEAILLSANDSIVVVGPDHSITYVNPATRRLLQMEIETGAPLESLVEAARARELDGRPVDLNELALAQALRTGKVVEKRVMIDGQSGPDTVLSVCASPICGPSGGVQGAVGIFRDVTAHWKAEDALRESEEKYRSLVDMVPHGIAELDEKGRMVFANSALCAMHGLAEHEIIGKPVWQMVEAGPEREELRAFIGRIAAEQPPPQPYRARTPTRDGRIIDMEVDWNYKRDREGRVTGFTALVIDVTDRLTARRELERSYEREHRIAEIMQSSLMRPIPRRIGGFAFEKFYKAASEEARVGGDFYDVFQLNADKVGIVIGDVSGKGLKAAVQVAAAKYSLRGRAYESYSPGTVMNQVNKTLVQDLDAEGFTSVFLGILGRAERALLYVNAGHAPVIHWDSAESRAVLFEPTGPVVGVDVEATFEERHVQLKLGDELLLGTDGLYELRCGDSFLEIGRLLDIYADMKSQGVCSAMELVDRVVSFCHGDLRDDIAILRVSVEG